MLQDNPARWVLLPIKFHSVWTLFKKHEHDFWTAEQALDKCAWAPADTALQTVAIRLIQAEVRSGLYSELMEWICDLLDSTTSPEARAFYGFECAFTTIHHEALSMLLAKAPDDTKTKAMLAQRAGEQSAVAQKRSWILFLLNQQNMPFAERLLIHALVKSVMNATRCLFSGLLHAQHQLPAVESVLRRLTQTERLHCQFAALCYSLLKHRLPQEHLLGLVQQCVQVEQMYGLEIVEGADVLQIKEDEFKAYVQHVGDSVLTEFGCQVVRSTPNAFADVMKLDCCTVPPLSEVGADTAEVSSSSSDDPHGDEKRQQPRKLGGSKFDTECDF
eukprot:GHVS01094779.1.p1 GENE.GHVS01094779.1~~GHVS01094779.1.p1  ORF type:complete len:331 (-),score=60.90 GHVS01094779.1:258-1250(-)